MATKKKREDIRIPAKLTKDITRYGDSYQRLSKLLYYTSDRSIEQYKLIRRHPMCRLGLEFIKLGLSEVPPVLDCDNEEIKPIIEKMYKKIWKQLVREALEKLDFGFKAMENRYEVGVLKYKDDEGDIQQFNGILMKQPRGVDGETVEIIVDENDGTFKGFRQDYDNSREVLAEDMKALVFTNQFFFRFDRDVRY